MVPVLTTTAGLCRSQPKALEHGPFLLEGVIVAFAAAEAVLEVLVVLVVRIGLLGVHTTLEVRFGIGAQDAGARGGDAVGSTVACEVALLEDLDEGVLAVALDGARVADAGRGPCVGVGRGWRVARQAREDVLSQGTEDICAAVNAL